MSGASLEKVKGVQGCRTKIERQSGALLQFRLQLNEYDTNGQSREQADRAVLMEEYMRLRQLEYEMTCLNEAEKMYALARDGEAWNGNTVYFKNMKMKKCKTTQGHSNYQLPRGYAGYAASSPARKAQVEDCAARFGDEFGWNATYYTCALASSCMVAQISDKMNEGVPDGMGNQYKRNLMIKGKGDNPNGTMASYNVSSIPADCKIGDGSKYVNTTVNQLIADGTIGAGDQVIVESDNGSSGRHAVTVAAVERDETGRVVGYTIQANNKSHLVSCELKYDKNGKPYGGDFGGRKVKGAILTHKWMDKKLEAEQTYLQGLSLEELKAQVAATQARVVGTYNAQTQQFQGGLMADLAATEQSNARKGYLSSMGNLYTQDGDFLAAEMDEVRHQMASVQKDLACVAVLDSENLGRMVGVENASVQIPVEIEPSLAVRELADEARKKKRKKNIFQKVGSWFKGAAEDTGAWFKGAYATVVKGKGSTEDEPTHERAPLSTDKMNILLEGADEQSVQEMAQAPAPEAQAPASQTAQAFGVPDAQIGSISLDELEVKGVPEMGIKPVEVQADLMSVHDFYGVTADFWEGSNSMSAAAEAKNDVLAHLSSTLFGDFTRDGSAKEAMKDDYSFFLEALGMTGENEGADMNLFGFALSDETAMAIADVVNTSAQGPARKVDMNKIIFNGGFTGGRV